MIPGYSFTRVHLYQCKAHTRLRVPRAPGVPHALYWAEELNNASGASRREGVNARLKSGIFVGWAKPPGPANARPMTGSACPPFKNDDVDGGHGASAPLPTLRNLIEYERVRHAQPSSPAKRAIQYSEVLVMESKSRSVLDTPLEPVIGLPQARPGGGV